MSGPALPGAGVRCEDRAYTLPADIDMDPRLTFGSHRIQAPAGAARGPLWVRPGAARSGLKRRRGGTGRVWRAPAGPFVNWRGPAGADAAAALGGRPGGAGGPEARGPSRA